MKSGQDPKLSKKRKAKDTNTRKLVIDYIIKYISYATDGNFVQPLYSFNRQEISISNIEAELLINQQQVADLTRHNKELQVQIKDRETDFHQNEVSQQDRAL